MYYLNLLNINQQYNLNLPPESLEKLNDELMVIAPSNVISPRTLSNRTNISYESIAHILTLLSSLKLVETEFMLECSNDDPEEVDAYIFDSKAKLNNFIINNNEICPECSAELSLRRAYVTFKAKRFSVLGVENL